MYVGDIFKRYKQKIKDGKIYDPIRDKFVAMTPEEIVRQNVIKFLLQRMKVPTSRIGVEKTLSSLGDCGNRKRVDICIFGQEGEILAVIECKKSIGKMQEAPFYQALDYVESLKVRNYFVVDCWDWNGYHYDAERVQFDVIEEIPTYEQLLLL